MRSLVYSLGSHFRTIPCFYTVKLKRIGLACIRICEEIVRYDYRVILRGWHFSDTYVEL